jgi:hypothetical protein
MLPPTGPAVVQFPATSQTSFVFVCASLVSTPTGTEVVKTKLASAGSARPDSVSSAVQLIATSPACQMPSGDSQTTSGGFVSAWLTPPPGMARNAKTMITSDKVTRIRFSSTRPRLESAAYSCRWYDDWLKVSRGSSKLQCSRSPNSAAAEALKIHARYLPRECVRRTTDLQKQPTQPEV